jgi:predicted transcriptional regulator
MSGRKSYNPTPEDLELVQKLKEVGSTDKEIARVLGISYTTFKKYKNDLFDPYILKGKEIRKIKLLSLVDDAVLKLIQGYYVEEVQSFYRGDTLHKKIGKTRYVRPNVRLLIFLLCNLDPEHYKPLNKIESPHGVGIRPAFKIVDLVDVECSD